MISDYIPDYLMPVVIVVIPLMIVGFYMKFSADRDGRRERRNRQP